MVLEKTLESPLDCKEIQPVHSEEDQPWDFFGRNDAEAETLILWLPNAKNWPTGKDPNAGKEWRQEKKQTRWWDGWMASLTQQTWVWASSKSCCWTGKPGMLQAIGSQRVGHDWATELTDLSFYPFFLQLWKMGMMSYLILYSSTQPLSGIQQALNHYMMNDVQGPLEHKETSAWLLCWFDRLLVFWPIW